MLVNHFSILALNYIAQDSRTICAILVVHILGNICTRLEVSGPERVNIKQIEKPE